VTALLWALVALALAPPDPPLSDLGRFPPFAVAQAGDCLSGTHLIWCEERLAESPLPQKGAAADWRREADGLHDRWDALRDAGYTSYGDHYRRARLGRLRELLGDEAYFAGWMPPPVPLWRFQSGD